MMRFIIYFSACCFLLHSCSRRSSTLSKFEEQQKKTTEETAPSSAKLSGNTIHVLVALCDNKYQGIVPVPAKIGNGQDPHNNLYWGCGYGIRTYFKKSSEWKLLKTIKLEGAVLERLVFKHSKQNYYLVADAYDGQCIQQCTEDFLYGLSGKFKDTLGVDGKTIGLYGHAKLLSYIGHDGLMDFSLSPSLFNNVDNSTRDCIILACRSKEFFNRHLKKAKANPLIWTTGNMCPEAYTLHDALSGYLKNESAQQVQQRAAAAYHKYQKCGEKAAKRLLATGW